MIWYTGNSKICTNGYLFYNKLTLRGYGLYVASGPTKPSTLTFSRNCVLADCNVHPLLTCTNCSEFFYHLCKYCIPFSGHLHTLISLHHQGVRNDWPCPVNFVSYLDKTSHHTFYRWHHLEELERTFLDGVKLWGWVSMIKWGNILLKLILGLKKFLLPFQLKIWGVGRSIF